MLESTDVKAREGVRYRALLGLGRWRVGVGDGIGELPLSIVRERPHGSAPHLLSVLR